MIGRHNIAKPIANFTTHAKTEKAKRDQREKIKVDKGTTFKLKNSLLNDLIVNNDTSKLYADKIKLMDPFTVTYTG